MPKFWEQIGNLLVPHDRGSRVDVLKSNIGDKLNYSEFNDKGSLTLHGKARTLRHLRVGAGSWNNGVNAPTPSWFGVFKTLLFDNSSDDDVHYTLIIPAILDLSVDIEFAVDWFYDSFQDNGTVCWALEYKGIKAGETVVGAGTIIAKTSAGNHLVGKMVRTVFTSKILAANLEKFDTLGIRLFRDVDGAHDAGDTLDESVALINTHFHFIQNKLGEAL